MRPFSSSAAQPIRLRNSIATPMPLTGERLKSQHLAGFAPRRFLRPQSREGH
jgi:hypothetical protein